MKDTADQTATVPGASMPDAGAAVHRALAALVCVGGSVELLIVGAQQAANGVRIERGLWLSMAGYAGLALAALGYALPERAHACWARWTLRRIVTS